MCMNTNAWPNAANDEVESNETQWNDKSKRLEVFAKKFAEDIYLKTDEDKRFTMLKSYFSNDSYTSEQQRDVLKFAWESSEFSDLSIDEINFFMIRKHFNKSYIEFNSNCVMLKNKVLKHYDISHNQYLSLGIQSKLESLSVTELKNLLKSSVKMEEFMTEFQADKDVEIEEKHLDSILPKNFNEIIANKINSLEEPKKQEVVNVLKYFENSSIRDDSFSRNFSEKIDFLYRENILTKSEVKDLIITFVPSLTLKDAQKITWDNKKIELKNNILSKLNLESANITEDEKNAIYDNLWELLIDTKEFLDNNILKLDDLAGDKKIFEKAWNEIKNTLIQKENKNWVSTIGGFKEALKNNKKIKGLPNFIRWGYIEYIIKNKNWDEIKNYYQIESNPETVKDGKILLINRWVNALGWVDWTSPTSFEKLLEDFKILEENKLFVWFNVYSKEDINTKIKSTGKDKIIEDNDIWEFNTDTQIESNINRRTQEIDNNSELSQEERDERIKEIKEEENIFNIQLLEKKVNHIDSQWTEYGLEEWTTISYTDDEKNINTITVVAHNHNSITVDHWNGQKPEQLLFDEFFQAFKRDPAPKRISKMKVWSELIDRLKSDSKDLWGDMIFEKGKLIKKTKNSNLEEEKTEYDLFIWERDIPGLKCNLMKLHKIDWNKAIISYWEAKYEKASVSDKNKIDEDIKDNWAKKEYSIDSTKYEIPLGVFHNYITQSGAISRNFEKETEQSELPEEVEMKSGLMSRIFQRASLADLIASGKLIIDSIENKLKEGNEEMAAKWADKVPLPKELKADMQTRIEQAQKKRWDEFFDRLKTVDSKVAIDMIKAIIEDRNSPEAKREACLQFMAKQYGNLYTKKQLFVNQGRFLWYTSFWWTIWDKMYREAEAKAKKDGTNFTEHELMISLLWAQCKWNPPKPKRRSKLHKEYKAMMGDGKKDEQEKWAKDASDKRTFDGRLYGVALDELKDGGFNNAIWAIEELIWKWDDGRMDRLETLPFVMMMSWIAYDFDSDIQQKIRWPLWNGVPMISLGYMSTNKWIGLYNNAVVEISKILEKDNPSRYSWMAKKAEKIVISSKKTSTKPKDRVNAALEFYEEYSDILSRTMNMTASRRTDTEAKYESLLQINAKRDDGDKECNQILKAYYNDYAGTRNAFFDADKADGYMEDAYQSKTGEWAGWISWMSPEEVFKSGFKWKPGQSYALKSAEMLHNEFVDQLIAYTNTDFDNPGEKEDMIEEYIQAYIYGFLHNHEKNIANSMKSPGFKFIWLTNASDFEWVTASDFASMTPVKKRSKESIMLLKRLVSNVIGKNQINNNSIFDITNVGWFVDGIKNQTNSVINHADRSANDENIEDDLRAA